MESDGVEGIKKKPTRPITIESNPSYFKVVRDYKKKKGIPKRAKMKIQAHPAFPPIPFMFSIAAASNPEKAPAS